MNFLKKLFNRGLNEAELLSIKNKDELIAKLENEISYLVQTITKMSETIPIPPRKFD